MVNLQKYLHTKNRALDIVFPGFDGISIGGALATGVHGSSLKNVSTLAEQVLSIDVIYEKDGKAYEENLKPSSPYFNAWLSNMGSLGIIKHVYLKTVAQYILESEIKIYSEEIIYDNKGFNSIVESCDFAQMVWFPGLRTLPSVKDNLIVFWR